MLPYLNQTFFQHSSEQETAQKQKMKPVEVSAGYCTAKPALIPRLGLPRRPYLLNLYQTCVLFLIAIFNPIEQSPALCEARYRFRRKFFHPLRTRSDYLSEISGYCTDRVCITDNI